MSGVSFSPFAQWSAKSAHLEFPPEARRRAIDAITDVVGCQFAGSAEPIAQMLLTTFPSSPAKSAMMPAPLIGSGRFAGPSDAALFNGTVAHALDYDDTNHPAYAHPSAVLVPAMLAVSQISEPSGREFVNTYIIGFDLIGKLGRAFNTGHYERGWHATKTFGCLAAALAAGSILRLNHEKIGIALAIAASSASGLRANFGTMVKPLHAGQAAQTGVSAALLARAGFTAGENVLDHRYGYANLFAGDGGARLIELETPGHPLEILTEFGLALKPYPSCGATHPAIEAAIKLHHRLNHRVIKKVHIGAARLAFAPLIYENPGTPLESKFSMQFCIAAALTRGEIGIDTFEQKVLDSPEIRSVIANTVVEVDSRVSESREFAAVVSVVTEDDEKLEERVDLAKGKPSRPLSADELKAKFKDCCGRILSTQESSETFKRLQDLDSAARVSNVVDGMLSKRAMLDDSLATEQQISMSCVC
jgi:2-methylcitrate dehydratase PrpD